MNDSDLEQLQEELMVPEGIETVAEITDWFTKDGVYVANIWYLKKELEGHEQAISRAKKFLDQVKQGYRWENIENILEIKRIKDSNTMLEKNMQRINDCLFLTSDGQSRGTTNFDFGNDSLNRIYALMNAQFSQLNEKFDRLESSTNERFDRLENSTNERFDRLENSTNERFSQMNARLDRLENSTNERFSQMNERFSQMNERFSQMNERFDRLERSSNEKFNQMNERFDRLESSTNEKFSQMNAQFSQINGRLATLEKQQLSSTSRVENRYKGRGGPIGSSSAYMEIVNKYYHFPSEQQLQSLHSSDQIDSMSSTDLNRYLRFYGLEISGSAIEKKIRLKEFIGVKLPLETNQSNDNI